MFTSIRFMKFKSLQVISMHIFQKILVFLVILGEICLVSLKCVFWKITKIGSSFSRIMLLIPNLDQLFINKFGRGSQFRIFDFCLDCSDFGHFCSFCGENWPKMAKIFYQAFAKINAAKFLPSFW